MSFLQSYLNKEIPEWTTLDLSNWLLDNKFKKLSEIIKKNNVNGYDIFFINDEILKNEFGLNSFHERITTLKTLKKLMHTYLKLNIRNVQNGEEKTIILDNNINISLKDISKSIGNTFNINPDDIIYQDYSKSQIISSTMNIIELMLLFPKLYKTLNIRQKQSYSNRNKKKKNVNLNNDKIKMNNQNQNQKYDIRNINNTINYLNEDKNNEEINSKMNVDSGNNSSSVKPSIELYLNDIDLDVDPNQDKKIKKENKIYNENERYLFSKKKRNMESQRNNINRNYPNSPTHFAEINKIKTLKEKNKNSKSSAYNTLEKDKQADNNNKFININNNNDIYNRKLYFNFHDGLSIENSDYLDKNASSNEGENKSKIYINNIIKYNGGDSENSRQNNSFPSLDITDKYNNNKNENDKMDLRHLNNEIINENDTKPLNMKQSYKGPQKNRVFNEDIIGGNL